MKLQSVSIRTIISIAAVVVIFIAAISLSQWLSTSEQAIAVTERFGYLGLLVIGIVTGLNFVIPIPAATFSALYSAAGLATTGIILALAFGTLIADMIGYWVGTKLRLVLSDTYPKISGYAKRVAAQSTFFILIFVLLYAAFVPFPNEAILIPLAISGIKLRYLVLPLLIGNIMHQTILIMGVDTLTRFIF